MYDPDARAAGFHAWLRARRLARRDAWRRSGGDPEEFAEIMRGHIATRFLYYYEDEPPRRPSVWRELRADAVMWSGWCLAAALVIVVSDRL